MKRNRFVAPEMWDVYFDFINGRSTLFASTERTEANWLYSELLLHGSPPVTLRVEGEMWIVQVKELEENGEERSNK